MIQFILALALIILILSNGNIKKTISFLVFIFSAVLIFKIFIFILPVLIIAFLVLGFMVYKAMSGKKYYYNYSYNTNSGNSYYSNVNSNKKNYYSSLGLEEGADVDDIKKAYKKMVKKYHPDFNSHLSENEKKENENKIREINEAYEQLKRNV